MSAWKPIATAPQDGTPILAVSSYACAMMPVVAFFGTFHPNQPGKPCWRDAHSRFPLQYLVWWDHLPPPFQDEPWPPV